MLEIANSVSTTWASVKPAPLKASTTSCATVPRLPTTLRTKVDSASRRASPPGVPRRAASIASADRPAILPARVCAARQ